MDANETYREKSSWEIHHNVSRSFDPSPAKKKKKKRAVRPLTSRLTRYARLEKSGRIHWQRSHGGTNIGPTEKNNAHQLCADTGCSLEDLSWTIGSDGERERERENLGYRHDMSDDEDDDDDVLL